MTSLFDYQILVNEVFYRCWHILEYIEKHPNMSKLDKQAIKATIMDALVTKKQIDPNVQSLDLENLCIVDNLDHYNYEKHPNISGIPLWMKEKFRKKALNVADGIPTSILLAKPSSKLTQVLFNEPNIAVSSIFQDATFYDVTYCSLTGETITKKVGHFVEVNIDGENYLIDTQSKRILKSSWCKEIYDFEINDQLTVSKMNKEQLKHYKKQISESKKFATILPFILPNSEFYTYENDEIIYEFEESKKYFPDAWEQYEKLKKDEVIFSENFLIKNNKPQF